MLTKYFKAAMAHARYEYLENDKLYYGEVGKLPGVWAAAETLKETRIELREVVEDWIMLRLRRNYSIPELNGVSLEPAKPSSEWLGED